MIRYNLKRSSGNASKEIRYLNISLHRKSDFSMVKYEPKNNVH